MTTEELRLLKEEGIWTSATGRVHVSSIDTDYACRIINNARRIYQNRGNSKEAKQIAGAVMVYFGERFFPHLTPGRGTFTRSFL